MLLFQLISVLIKYWQWLGMCKVSMGITSFGILEEWDTSQATISTSWCAVNTPCSTLSAPMAYNTKCHCTNGPFSNGPGSSIANGVRTAQSLDCVVKKRSGKKVQSRLAQKVEWIKGSMRKREREGGRDRERESANSECLTGAPTWHAHTEAVAQSFSARMLRLEKQGDAQEHTVTIINRDRVWVACCSLPAGAWWEIAHVPQW